jgi:hypothetical protein
VIALAQDIDGHELAAQSQRKLYQTAPAAAAAADNTESVLE